MPAFDLPQPVLVTFIGIGAVLMAATLIELTQRERLPQDVRPRLKAWWGMVAIYGAAALIGRSNRLRGADLLGGLRPGRSHQEILVQWSYESARHARDAPDLGEDALEGAARHVRSRECDRVVRTLHVISALDPTDSS